MASAPLESTLNDIFGKKAPQMPAGGRKFFVDVAPWLALIGGIWTLLSVLSLWHWAHVVNNLNNFAHDLCTAYSNDCGGIATSRLTAWIWLTLLFLLVQGVIYLLAFPGLHDRKKAGWTYIYYGMLVSVVFDILQIFNGYGGFFGFVWGIVGAAIGFWILFQIRGSYAATGVRRSPAPKPPVAQ